MRGASIELITHCGPHAQLIGAESELLEAVLHNTVDATPRGGTITIRTGLDAGRATVSVSDTGVGMSETVLRRAFEPFFSTKGETGLGLGLSMVYGVLARHGGDATVDSEDGRGTTVVPPPADVGRRWARTARGARDGSGACSARRRRDRAHGVGDMLRAAAYAVTLTGSGLARASRRCESTKARTTSSSRTWACRTCPDGKSLRP